MKIADIQLFELEGVMVTCGEFWEERLVRPIDIYPEHAAEGPGMGVEIDESRVDRRTSL